MLLGLRLELCAGRYLVVIGVVVCWHVYECFRLLVVGIPGCEVWCMTSCTFIIRYCMTS